MEIGQFAFEVFQAGRGDDFTWEPIPQGDQGWEKGFLIVICSAIYCLVSHIMTSGGMRLMERAAQKKCQLVRALSCNPLPHEPSTFSAPKSPT